MIGIMAIVSGFIVILLSALIVLGRRPSLIPTIGSMVVLLGSAGSAVSHAASDPPSSTTLHEPILAKELSAGETDLADVATNVRPAWVDEVPAREEGTHTQVVSSGPHVRVQDAYKSLDEQLKQETDSYVRWYLGSETAPHVIDVDLQYIKQHLRNPELTYSETRDYSVGPMKTMYARLDFDERFRKELDQQWQIEVSKNRLWITALASGGVFILLLTVFAYLRLDTATRGYYSGRLQWLTFAAILTLVAAGVVAAKLVGIQWLK